MKKLVLCGALAAAGAVVALLVAAPALSDKWYTDPEPGAPGGIQGKVIDGELADAVALEQVAFKVYHGSVDKASNSYSFSGLPPGKYDLLLKLTADVIEGFRLDDFGEVEPIPKADKDAIYELIRISDDFFHAKNIVRMGGSAKLQKLLVEQIRTKTIYNPDGTIATGRMIRRIDYTILHKTRAVWQIDPNCPRYMFRQERNLAGAGSTLTYHHNTALSEIRVGDTVVNAPEVSLKKCPPVKQEKTGLDADAPKKKDDKKKK